MSETAPEVVDAEVVEPEVAPVVEVAPAFDGVDTFNPEPDKGLHGNADY